MALTNLQKQLIQGLWTREATRLENIEPGSGYKWVNENLILASAADKKAAIVALADKEREARVNNKAARPALKTQQDQADDDAVALIDAAKTGL